MINHTVGDTVIGKYASVEGIIGKVVDVFGTYTVESLDGRSYSGWSRNDSWIKIPNSFRAMTLKDVKVDQVLFCLKTPDIGSRGLISQVIAANEFIVKDIDGMQLAGNSIESFWIKDESTQQSIPIPKEVSMVINSINEVKPCPMKYYGIDPCTCGKCKKSINPYYIK